MEEKYFLTQVQRSTEGIYTKGVVVKDSLDAARQSFHAYLGTYGFGNNQNVNYVAVAIMDMGGRITDLCVDDRIPRTEPAEE